MKQMNQTPYADIAAVNETHLACAIILDVSGSMNGAPLREVVQGVELFKKQTAKDDLAMKRVDVAIVSMGDKVKVEQDFIPLSKFSEMPELALTAGGQTPMGEAIETTVQLVRDRCRVYDEAGVPHFKSWIFMLTDGQPTDDISNAKTLVRQREDTGRLKFFSVAVKGADTKVLQSISKRVIEADNEDDFKGIFNWLSESMSVISASRVEENPQLPELPENFRVVPTDW